MLIARYQRAPSNRAPTNRALASHVPLITGTRSSPRYVHASARTQLFIFKFVWAGCRRTLTRGVQPAISRVSPWLSGEFEPRGRYRGRSERFLAHGLTNFQFVTPIYADATLYREGAYDHSCTTISFLTYSDKLPLRGGGLSYKTNAH